MCRRKLRTRADHPIYHLCLPARLYPTSHWAGSSPSPLTIYFTSRSVDRGKESLAKLTDELAAENDKVLAKDGGLTTFKYHQLDITDAASRAKLLETLKKEEGGLDLLVNNAGIALNGFDAEVVKDTLHTNYYSTRDIILEYLPSIRKGGRVVTLASMAGKLTGYSDGKVQEFTSASTVQDVDKLMQAFQESVSAGKHEEAGYKSAAYSVSKAGVIALHRALAKQKEYPDVLINSCCPGYVSTRMTKEKGHLTLDEGSATPVTVALDDISGKSGTFWEKQKESSW